MIKIRGTRTLNLGLNIVNGVRRLHLKGDSLTREGLDEDLHLDEGLQREIGQYECSHGYIYHFAIEAASALPVQEKRTGQYNRQLLKE